MAPLPLSRLEFVATSVAEELGFIALADLAAASPGEEARVIGGHMVSLHALRWQLELPRETLDADLGVTPEIVQTPDLIDRLLRLGYERLGGNRFGRRIEGLPAIEGETPQAIVDVLVPSYTSRPRHNRTFGDHLTTTEVPGLAGALLRPAIDVPITFRRRNGLQIQTAVRIPDEVAALVLKVMARTIRRESKDAVDVWRCLEICHAAGVSNADLGPDADAVITVLDEDFGRAKPGIAAIRSARGLATGSTLALETRIRALVDSVLPSS